MCHDPLCAKCTGFGSGLCYECVANAAGSPCACSPGYMIDTDGFNCLKLAIGCLASTGVQYNQCLSCLSPFYLLNTMCGTQCPTGYTATGTTCNSILNPSLSIEFSDIIRLNTVGIFNIGQDNTNLYPNFETSDPTPVIYRGYYFSGKTGSSVDTFLISPWFTLEF